MKPAAVLLYGLCALAESAWGQVSSRVVDVTSRAQVTQRFVYLAPKAPKAAVILFAGGHGGLQIYGEDGFRWGGGNFLVRTRELFAARGLAVAVVDAPSDRQNPPFLAGFRQTPEHVADMKAVIGWVRRQAGVPVWLVGTSNGTFSAAFVATQLTLADGGPDGVVLTSTILRVNRGRSVPELPLGRIRVPVLVAHHRHDGCMACPYGELPRLMDKLTAAPRKSLLTFEGGRSLDAPCEAFAHHGFNGLEGEVVGKIAHWIVAG